MVLPLLCAGPGHAVASGAYTPGTWTPADISTLYWYDFGDTGARSLSGSDYTQLNDKSGNGLHLTPNSGAPTVATAALNGLDTGAFNGVNQDLARTGLNIANRGVDQTIVALFKMTDTASRIPFFTYDNLTVGNLAYFHRIGGNMNFMVNAGNACGYASTNTTDYLLMSGLATTALREIWEYGTSKATDSDAATNGPIRWIIIGSATTQFLLGNVAEVVGIPPDTGNQQKLEGYMAGRWGLETSLDPAHPYRFAGPN